jgi:hypothetical protein
MGPRTCPVCGTESLVTAFSSGPHGPQRPLCAECERRRLGNERTGVREITRDWATLLIYAGILLTILTLSVDRLSISGHAGFGWRQITGTEAGILILIVGFLAGRRLIGMAGLFLLVVSVGADVLQLGHAPGLGWRKQTALALACLLIVGGLICRRALRNRAQVGIAGRHDSELV